MDTIFQISIWALPILIVAALIIGPSLKIINQYQRAVVYLLGNFWKVKGPGPRLIVPIIQTYRIVEVRTVTLDVPPQDVITKDNVSCNVNAVVYYRIHDPDRAINQVSDYELATRELAQTRLRSILGEHSLDEILQQRQKISNDLQMAIDELTEEWGIKVENVEIKDIDIDASMRRIMARRAEAQRDRDAKIIEADGERRSAENLIEAARILSAHPEAMQLRYLATLNNIANDRSSTIVFPMPTSLMDFLTGALHRPNGSAEPASTPTDRLNS